MTGDYGSHPDDHYDPKALPVDRIQFQTCAAATKC